MEVGTGTGCVLFLVLELLLCDLDKVIGGVRCLWLELQTAIFTRLPFSYLLCALGEKRHVFVYERQK